MSSTYRGCRLVPDGRSARISDSENPGDAESLRTHTASWWKAAGVGVARRVFLSHKTELRKFPESRSFVAAAEAALARAGYVPVDMAHFPADDKPPAVVSENAVR